MRNIRIFLLVTASIPFIAVLLWYFSVPSSLINKRIEESISESAGSGVRAEITGLSKGPFFDIHIESMAVYEKENRAFDITDVSARINPVYLYKKNIVLKMEGSIGKGKINGELRLPEGGVIKTEGIALDSVAYLKSLGINAKGILSSETVLSGNSSETRFTVEELDLKETPFAIIPLINSFRQVKGLVNASKDKITVTSLSFDGDKGYARAKGDIVRGNLNIVVELMPESGRLEEFEKMMLRQYESSPGLYVFPYNGRL